MKKVGVVIIAVLLLSALSVFVSAQECVTGDCVDASECRPDEQCTAGCCEPIPCETDIDCPIPCPPPEPGSFAPTVCNTCVDGFCEDPCSCDFGVICGGSGPCLSGAPKCVLGDCEHCVTDCDCPSPTRPFTLACPGAPCSGPFGVCQAGSFGGFSLCYRSPSPGRDVCSSNTCVTAGTATCAASCAFNTQCSDGNPCTDDVCSSGSCTNTANSASCDDGVFCNGVDTCGSGSCSVHAGDPCPGPDGDGDCSETCNEGADACTSNDPDSSVCDDGTFCNGADTCISGGCDTHAGDPCPGPDGDIDCMESCREPQEDCVGNDPNGAVCDDGDVCTGEDDCTGGTCGGDAISGCCGTSQDCACGEVCTLSLCEPCTLVDDEADGFFTCAEFG